MARSIALLVIAPSKTDRERVIPMSADLFHVIASLIRRHARTGRPIPLVTRYDPHDGSWSPPMPFLLQRQYGTVPAVFNPGMIQKMIERRCLALAEVPPGFKGLKFTPQDSVVSSSPNWSTAACRSTSARSCSGT